MLGLAVLVAPCAAWARPWRQLGPDQAGDTPITALAYVAGTGGEVLVGLGGAGVERSVDDGVSWRPSSAGIAPDVTALVPHPGVPGRVYALADGFIQRSADGGSSWSATLTGGEPVAVVAPVPGDPKTVYAGTSGGLFISRNGGVGWEPAASRVPLRGSVLALAVDAFNPSFLYVGVAGPDRGLWTSADGGRSWIRRLRSVPFWLSTDPHHSGAVYLLNENYEVEGSRDAGATFTFLFQGNYLSQFPVILAYDPAERDTLYLTNGGLYKTLDGGRHWQGLLGVPSSIVASALVVGAGGTILVGGGPSVYGRYPSGVFRSGDGGGHWSPASRGIVNTSVSALAVTTTGALFVALPEQIERSLDGGASWTTSLDFGVDPFFLAPLALAAAPSDPDTIFVGTTGGIWKTSDGGATWAALPFPQFEVDQVVVDPADAQNVFLVVKSGSGIGLYRSTNGGAGWFTIAEPGLVNDLALPAATPGAVFAVGYSGVFRSLDHGDTWTQVLSPAVLGSDSVLEVVVGAPSAPGLLYVVAGQFVDTPATLLRTTDNGTSWTDLGPRLPTSTASGLVAVDPVDSETLLVADNLGVLALTLGGQRVRLNEGLFVPPAPSLPTVAVLSFDPVDPQRLYAGTYSAGLLERRFPARAAWHARCTTRAIVAAAGAAAAGPATRPLGAIPEGASARGELQCGGAPAGARRAR